MFTELLKASQSAGKCVNLIWLELVIPSSKDRRSSRPECLLIKNKQIFVQLETFYWRHKHNLFTRTVLKFQIKWENFLFPLKMLALRPKHSLINWKMSMEFAGLVRVLTFNLSTLKLWNHSVIAWTISHCRSVDLITCHRSLSLEPWKVIIFMQSTSVHCL